MTTLRQMAVAFELPTATLLERLELAPEHHDVDAQLTTHVETLYATVLVDANQRRWCWCGTRARGWVRPRGDVPGHVCSECSPNHCELHNYMRSSGLLP